MALVTPVLLLLAAGAAHSAPSPADSHLLSRRDKGQDYIDLVCYPKVDSNDYASLPPCVAIENIASACAPNGTSPLALEAHAMCMCGGSYFSEWTGCESCLFVHGARSDRDTAYYAAVMGLASSQLCDVATPTASLQDLFTSAESQVPAITSGATISSDQFPSQTDISNYYTFPTGTGFLEGPGPITGSATSATATVTVTTATPTSTPTGDSSSSSISSAGASDQATPTTSSLDELPSTSTSSGMAAAPTAFVVGNSQQAGLLYGAAAAAAAVGAAFVAI